MIRRGERRIVIRRGKFSFLTMVSASVRWLDSGSTETVAARVDIGRSANSSAPDAQCLLTIDDEPRLLVSLWQRSGEVYTFRDAQYWKGFLIIGWGHALFVIDPESASAIRHELGTYFGSMHADEVLLVASGERVVRVSTAGSIAWKSERVGIDGVTFSNVDAEFVDGSGEWDPPGEWMRYKLRLTDGAVVAGGNPNW